jgi:hypothetical protein
MKSQQPQHLAMRQIELGGPAPVQPTQAELRAQQGAADLSLNRHARAPPKCHDVRLMW